MPHQREQPPADGMQKTVIDRLKGAGLEAELRVLQAIRTRKGWFASGCPQYLDRDDEDKLREYDALAEFRLAVDVGDNGDGVAVEALLAIEVKRSNKDPWVVLRRGSSGFFNDEREALTAFRVFNPRENRFLGVRKAPGRTYIEIGQQSLRGRRLAWEEGYGLRELKGKADSGGNRGFSALVSACKAAESVAELHERCWMQGASWNFSYVTPVVVLDAQLFAVGIDRQGELAVQRAPYSTVRFHFQSKCNSREVYLVDVVTLEALPRYLENVEAGVPKVADALVSARNDNLQPEEARTMIDFAARRRYTG